MALTPFERRRRALEEVRASRPTGLSVVTTLELTHPAFDEPARVVNDNADLEATIETGETVTFRAVAFGHVGPAQTDGRWPEIQLSIDGAARLLEPYLDAALGSDVPIRLTFREYVRQRATEGPGRVIDGLELDQTRSGEMVVTGNAGFYGLDRKFGITYDPSVYPGLS